MSQWLTWLVWLNESVSLPWNHIVSVTQFSNESVSHGFIVLIWLLPWVRNHIVNMTEWISESAIHSVSMDKSGSQGITLLVLLSESGDCSVCVIQRSHESESRGSENNSIHVTSQSASQGFARFSGITGSMSNQWVRESQCQCDYCEAVSQRVKEPNCQYDILSQWVRNHHISVSQCVRESSYQCESVS